MDLKILNKICFTICIVCIIVGVVLGLALIWGSHDSEMMWKGLGTVAVLFMGSALTLAVSNTFGRDSHPKHPNDKDA
jgi:hypothetical protein